MKALVPNNEAARLEALHRYGILDTQAEEAFDDLTALAAYICQTPIALISLIDKDRQWFKSKLGVTISETSRDIAFCAQAILQPDLFVVPDALADARFASNPLVTVEPKVRFYAGVPLTTQDDFALGTLCVLDRVPRDLTREQSEALRDLGSQVIVQMELRRNSRELARAIEELRQAEAALREKESALRDFLDHCVDLVQTVSPEGCFVNVNRPGRRRSDTARRN